MHYLCIVKEFARHIEVLLLDNDCVIVPGFGGFISHRVSSRRVEEENLFLPPYRTIGFNPAMKLNDGLLVQSYMLAYDASYPEAIKLVESKVEELEGILQSDGEYELHGIGKLRQNIEGQNSFLPLESGILSPSLYGLGSFELLTLDEISHREEEERQAKEAAIAATKKQEPVLEPSFISEQNESKLDESSRRRERYINIAAACIAIVLTCLLALPFTNIGKSSKELKNQSLSEVVTKDYRSIMTKFFDALSLNTSTPKADVIKTSESAKKNSRIKQKNEVKKNATDTTAALKPALEPVKEEVQTTSAIAVSEQKSAPYYTIVLASQVSQKNAEIFIEKLNKRTGIQAEILKDKFTRIVYSKFQTQEEAQQKKAELKDIPEFKNVWIMEVR